MADCDHCTRCGAPLEQLDKALHRKLVNRGAETFLCKNCLSAHFDIPVPEMLEMAEYFRKQGCLLFL